MKKSQPFGTCKLCLEEKALQQSHYMPAALYPKKQKLQYLTRSSSGAVVEHMKAPLLCMDCERLFDQNGESEVLRYIAPKSIKRFPLHEKLRLALPRETDGSLSRFAGLDVGLDMDKFAYFTLALFGGVQYMTGLSSIAQLYLGSHSAVLKSQCASTF